MYDKKMVFWAACFGMLLFGIGLITLGSMAPDLKTKFQLDEVAAGTLFSILPIGILAGSLLFGPVCDRYGYKLMLTLACIGMFIGFEGISMIVSRTALQACIFIFGVSAGILNGATNAVVSDISDGAEGANLSLLGVFFGIGALGMPFVLGVLKNDFSSFQIIKAVGGLTLIVGLFYCFIHFPPSKKALGFGLAKTSSLFKERYLFLIAFYLFFQGSLEAIFNNWTTTYLTQYLSLSESKALYALSLYVAGMTMMRLLIGSVFRAVAALKLMLVSLAFVTAGILLVRLGQSSYASLVGLLLVGVGLAAGFPLMLGLAGKRYRAQSATAFSFIFAIALTGNMLVNYAMGVISKRYGIGQLTLVGFIELGCMLLLCILLFRLKPIGETETKTSPSIKEVSTS
jgi:fucose permease